LKKLLATLVLISGMLVSGCTENPGINNTYQSGDGTVTEFKKETRSEAVSWAGTTSDGYRIEAENLAGVVTVMNFWYAACTPCRVEMPDLVSLAKQYENKVQFIGVNVRDTAETANAFRRSFQVNFPTLIDKDTGETVLAFTGVVTPSAVPTTLVIDRDGKVAARILGLAEKSTLRTLIQTVLDEKTN